MLLGALFQQFYGLVDAIIVDRTLGQTAFSAVGITGSLSFLVLGFAQGTTAGFSVVASQYFGAKEMDKVRKSIATSFLLCVILTVILTALMAVFTRPLLQLLNTPEKYFENSYAYISTIFYGMGATILYNIAAYILRALGDSKTPLYFLVVACVLNIGMDLLFITSDNAGGHIAHLGGALAGLFFAAQLGKGRDLTAWINRALDGMTALAHRKPRKPKMKVRYGTGGTRQQDYDYNARKKAQSDEIDRILDKLRKTGYEGLSDEEKKSLFDASKR